ncbi:MAG: hypothetical protein ACLSVD_13870 [Eggerthellaceae bacterium]
MAIEPETATSRPWWAARTEWATEAEPGHGRARRSQSGPSVRLLVQVFTLIAALEAGISPDDGGLSPRYYSQYRYGPTPCRELNYNYGTVPFSGRSPSSNTASFA